MDGGSRGKDGRSEERMGGAGETTGGEVVHIKTLSVNRKQVARI